MYYYILTFETHLSDFVHNVKQHFAEPYILIPFKQIENRYYILHIHIHPLTHLMTTYCFSTLYNSSDFNYSAIFSIYL